MYVCMHVGVHVCTVYVCMYVYMYIRIGMSVYRCMCICIYVCICVCQYVYVYQSISVSGAGYLGICLSASIWIDRYTQIYILRERKRETDRAGGETGDGGRVRVRL